MVKRKQCPNCMDSGHDNLIVYEDGHTHCFACGYHQGVSEPSHSTPSTPVVLRGTTAFGIPNHPSVTPAALEEFGVLCESPTVLLFYSVGVDNQLISCKRRDYNLPKKQGIRMTGVNAIFGLNRQTGADVLIICEGEPDAIGMAQCVGNNADVWAIPGASATEYLSKLGHRLQAYKVIYLVFDNDEDGKAAIDRALTHLPEYKVKVVTLSGKDVCEMLDAGLNPLDDFYTAKAVENSSVVTGETLIESYLRYQESTQCQGFDTGYPGLNNLLGGSLKPTEVVLLVGHTGRGKSTFATNLAYNVAHLNKTKVLWVSTEMNYEQMAQKFIELDTRGQSSDDLDSLRWVADNILFYNDVKSMEQIEKAVFYSISVHNIGLVVVDVLNKVQKMRDWKEASVFVDRITSVWAQGSSRDKRPPVAVLLVCHTGKTDGRFREYITLDDIGGGTSYSQGVTCILSFMGTVDNPVRTIATLKKPRMGKAPVGSFQLEYSPEFCVYSELDYMR